MPTVITYKCPRCRTDIGRQFGLHTKLMIVCPNCGTNVRIDRSAIQQNWGFNFAWVGSLVIWFVLAVGVLASPELAAVIGRETFPADTFEHRLVIAGVSVVPSLLAGLVIGGVGMVFGTIVAASASASEANAGDFPSWPPRMPAPWSVGFPPPTGPTPAPPQSQHRSFFARAFFVLMWTVVVFFGTGIVLAMTAMGAVKPQERRPADDASTVGLLASPLGQGPLLAASSLLPQDDRDEQRRQDAAEKMGERSAPWLLLGTLAVFVLGCVGVLPGTGRKKRRQTAAQPDSGGLVPLGPATAWAYDFRGCSPVCTLESRRRSIFVRGSFVLLWPAVFFFGAAFTMAALAGGFSVNNEEVQRHIFKQSAEANVAWILLGSLIFFVVGCLGLLPGTGAKVRSRAA